MKNHPGSNGTIWVATHEATCCELSCFIKEEMGDHSPSIILQLDHLAGVCK